MPGLDPSMAQMPSPQGSAMDPMSSAGGGSPSAGQSSSGSRGSLLMMILSFLAGVGLPQITKSLHLLSPKGAGKGAAGKGGPPQGGPQRPPVNPSLLEPGGSAQGAPQGQNPQQLLQLLALLKGTQGNKSMLG